MARGANAGNRGQGHHWIRDEKRRRIYERDGWRCVWCSHDVAMLQSSQLPAIRDVLIREGATRTSWRQATLDHVLPRSRGGSNHESNLITCCAECNEKRGDTCAIDWAQDVSNIRPGWIYPVSGLSVAAAAILDRLIDAMGRELPPRKARAA